MPKLTVHKGFTSISYSIKGPSKTVKYGIFPFSYNQAYKSSFTEQSFMDFVVKRICSDEKLSKASCQVTEQGGMDIIIERLNAKQDFIPIYLDSWFMGSTNISSYSVPSDSLEDVYLRNYAMYPNVTPIYQKDYLKRDIIYIDFIKSLNIKSSTKILLTGDRFLNVLEDPSPYLSYFLSFVPSKDGIYDMYIDDKNAYILNDNFKLDSSEHFCTFYVRNSKVECLVKSDIGTQQLLEIDKDSLFHIPTQKDLMLDLLIKPSSGVSEEVVISGPRKGLIFDTRNKSNVKFDDVRLVEKSLDVLSSSTDLA